MSKSALAGASLAATIMALSACGGGGGTTSGSQPPAAAPAPAPIPGTGSGTTGATSPAGVTLKFTSDNAGRVAGYPLWASESLMRLGHALSDEVLATIAQPQPSRSGDCGDAGSWVRTWQDNDGNGTVSAGDVIAVQFTRCHREPLARTVDGAASVQISSIDAAGGFVAEMTVRPPGVGIAAAIGETQADFRVSGTARLALSLGVTQRTLTVGDGPNDAVVFDFPWLSVAGDRLTGFRMQKSQRWDDARSYLDLRMRYDSPELGGSFAVSTPAPIASWFDTLPDPFPGQGWLQMQGAGNDLVRIDVIGASGYKSIRVKVDFAGDGNVELSGDASWTDAGLVSGFFFADYTPGGRGNTFALDPNEFSVRRPSASAITPINDTLRVQFSRTPAGTAGWKWRLVDRGPYLSVGYPVSDVPITVEQLGALVLIKPSQPLRYSREYQLVLDTGTPTAQGQLLRATTGATLDLAGGSIAGFRTADYLNPRPGFAAQPFYLSAQGSRVGTLPQEEGAPPASYRWTQVGGEPVNIETPTAAQTNISLGNGASGIGSATLRLTMSLADGSSESADMVVRTVHDTHQAWASRVHVPALNFNEPEQWLWGGPAVGQMKIVGSGDRLSLQYSDRAGPAYQYPDWSLQVASADGAPLRPGAYTQAWSAGAVGRPAGSPLLEFDMRRIGFLPWGSDFTILELESDPSGTVTKLALDFVVRGVGDYTPITGSVRFNSSLPLAP